MWNRPRPLCVLCVYLVCVYVCMICLPHLLFTCCLRQRLNLLVDERNGNYMLEKVRARIHKTWKGRCGLGFLLNVLDYLYCFLFHPYPLCLFEEWKKNHLSSSSLSFVFSKLTHSPAPIDQATMVPSPPSHFFSGKIFAHLSLPPLHSRKKSKDNQRNKLEFVSESVARFSSTFVNSSSLLLFIMSPSFLSCP